MKTSTLKSILAVRRAIRQVEVEKPNDGSEKDKAYQLALQDLKHAMLILTGYVDDRHESVDH